VLIADDHPLFRKGLRGLLDEAPDMRVVAEARDGEGALESINGNAVDVAVLDLDMPKMGGLEIAQAVRDRRPPIRIVLLTAHKSDVPVRHALDAGVAGYLLKDGAALEIVECIRAVHAGLRFLSPELSALVRTRSKKADAFTARTPGLADLTAAELRVLKMVAMGKTSREIGDALFVSARTVEHHRAAIAEKLNLRGSNALVKFAAEHKSALLN
jgi:DNA-binding NarL/FixJ family response regulator